MAPLTPSNLAETAAVDDDLNQYRAVSGLAIAGLLAGMLSILSFVHPLCWLVPLAGIVVNILALRRIADGSLQLIGRKAALTGLALSLIFAISPGIERALYQRDLRVQSLDITREWFNALRDDRPEAAYRLATVATTAAAREQSPLKGFQSGMIPMQALRKFVRQSPMEILLKLGRRAHVRLYANADVWSDNNLVGVRDVFVVTVGEGPQAVSFFVLMGTTRSQEFATGEWQWQITKTEFVHEPPPELIQALGG